MSEQHGQGWTQLTDHGKIFLSKKEKNVFILEGTRSAGFSACRYGGSAEECSQIDSGTFSLMTELKCVPGDQCPEQQVFVLMDCLGVAELSAGCDFCAVHLCFDSRELRVESHRQNATTQTLFAQPSCALLRPNSYVTILLQVREDGLALTLNGVPLISHLPINRPRPAKFTGRPQVGIAVYGKTRIYIRRFKICTGGPAETARARGQETSMEITPYVGSPPVGSERGHQQRGSLTRRSYSTPVHGMPPAGLNVMGSAGASANSSNMTDEMDLIALIERDIVVGNLNVCFDDIGGLDDAKRAINEAVLLPLLIPEFFTGLRQPWKGVLLFGPPGTGKTMLAKAVASCAENVAFFNCSTATLTSKWRGESEKLLRALFQTARAKVPCILFFDEVDSLLSQRGSTAEHEASRRFKSEFLIHMDGLLSDARPEDGPQAGHLLVLATSNTPWDLDEALRRRLEKRIYIPLPDEAARLRMFEHNLQDICLGPDVDLAALAARTDRYSGADVQLICRDASMNPVRRLIDGLSPMELVQLRNEGRLSPGTAPVEMADFQAALASVQPSVSPGDLRRFEDWAREFGSR